MKIIDKKSQKEIIGGSYRFKVYNRATGEWYWDDNGGNGYPTYSSASKTARNINENYGESFHALDPVWY